MALMYQVGSAWVFKLGKHAGETLVDVVAQDPNYILKWMFRRKGGRAPVDDLSDDAYHALEDVMEEANIEVP